MRLGTFGQSVFFTKIELLIITRTKGKEENIFIEALIHMGKTNYRSSNIIIQNLLESIIRAGEQEGIVKSHLIELCGLKNSTAERYLTKMVDAKYIECFKEKWGERFRIKYRILPLGKQRYYWFVKINSELE